jgi:phospholipase/carboxylesterase
MLYNFMNKIETYPEVQAKVLPPKRLVVFFHGLGSDGNDLISLASLMKQDLPDCHFIAPHGIEVFDMAPPQGAGIVSGRQWFSLKERDPHKIQDLLRKNIPAITRIIQDKQEQLSITNKETILIGFSQGTMVSLYLSLIQDLPFACVIGFSGILIPPMEFKNKETKICLVHGEDDEVVDISEMYKAERYLLNYGIKILTHKIPNLRHAIDVSCIKLAINFIKTI